MEKYILNTKLPDIELWHHIDFRYRYAMQGSIIQL